MTDQVNTIAPQASMGMNSSQGLTRDQVNLIKTTICKGATDDELKLFVQTCNRTGLDAFARQIFAVKRSTWNAEKKTKEDVMTIQVSIDGFRLIAERSGKYAGQIGPFWTNDGTTWLDVWLDATPPKAAKVAVYRSDFKEPLWAVATWDQYSQKKQDGAPMGLWAKMPSLMLAKCAESLALRKAFPQELSGLYMADEMDQADTKEPKKIKVLPPAAPVQVQASPKNPEEPAWTEADAKQAFDILEESRKAFIALGHQASWDSYLAKKQNDMAASTPAIMIPKLREEADKCIFKVAALPPKATPPVDDLESLSAPTPDTADEVPTLQPGAEDVDAAQQIPASELNGTMVMNWALIAERLQGKGMKPAHIGDTKTRLMTQSTVGVDPSDSEAFERSIVRGQIQWLKENV